MSDRKFKQTLDGPLLEQINALNREGQTLSQPDVWDGSLASKFRSDWPQVHQTLTKVREALEELRGKLEQINQNIMQAGGNQ
jgi:uncharacterized protein YukE